MFHLCDLDGKLAILAIELDDTKRPVHVQTYYRSDIPAQRFNVSELEELERENAELRKVIADADRSGR